MEIESFDSEYQYQFQFENSSTNQSSFFASQDLQKHNSEDKKCFKNQQQHISDSFELKFNEDLQFIPLNSCKNKSIKNKNIHYNQKREVILNTQEQEYIRHKICNNHTNLTLINNKSTSSTNTQNIQERQSNDPFQQKNVTNNNVKKQNITGFTDIHNTQKNQQTFIENNSFKLFSPLSELYDNLAKNSNSNNNEDNHFNHFQSLNSKVPALVKVIKNQGIEVLLNNKENENCNLTQMINQLQQQNICQGNNQFMQAIQKYSNHYERFQQKQELIKYEFITNNFLKNIETKFKEFDIILKQKLEELSQTNCLYSYTLYQFNFKNFQIEQTKVGYSESLISLLGLDLQQAKQQILRKGIFQYTNQDNLLEFQLKQISILLGEKINNSFEVALQTFDDFQVPAINTLDIIIDKDVNNPFLDFNSVLFINTYQLEEKSLQNLTFLRQNHKELVNQRLKDLEEDVYYAMEANIFLQKYYKKQTENYFLYSQRAHYRLIN